MRHSHLSNDNANQIVEETSNDARQLTGVVDHVLDGGLYRVHFTDHSHAVCDIIMPVTGDDFVPTVGDPVQVVERSGEIPTIVGTPLTTDEDKRATDPGERVLGHPSTDTDIRFNADGSLTVTVSPDSGDALEWHFDTNGTTSLSVPPSSSPVLEFDSNGMHFADNTVMTDVSTSTDSDGHVTSVDPVYTTTISL